MSAVTTDQSWQTKAYEELLQRSLQRFAAGHHVALVFSDEGQVKMVSVFGQREQMVVNRSTVDLLGDIEKFAAGGISA